MKPEKIDIGFSELLKMPLGIIGCDAEIKNGFLCCTVKREAFCLDVRIGAEIEDEDIVSVTDMKKTDGGATVSCSAFRADEDAHSFSFDAKDEDIFASLCLYDFAADCGRCDIIKDAALCISEKRDIIGNEYLTGEELSLCLAGAWVGLCEYPRLVKNTEERVIADALEYSKEKHPDAASLAEAFISSKKNGRERHAAKALEKYFVSYSKTDSYEAEKNTFVDAVIKASSCYGASPYTDREAVSEAEKAIELKMKKLGYDGSYPEFVKGKKYMRFSLAASYYEYENDEYFRDIAVTFGNGKKKNKGEAFLIRAAEAVRRGECEEKLDLILGTLDAALDGEKTSPEFKALSEVKERHPDFPMFPLFAVMASGAASIICAAVFGAASFSEADKLKYILLCVGFALVGVFFVTGGLYLGKSRFFDPAYLFEKRKEGKKK